MIDGGWTPALAVGRSAGGACEAKSARLCSTASSGLPDTAASAVRRRAARKGRVRRSSAGPGDPASRLWQDVLLQAFAAGISGAIRGANYRGFRRRGACGTKLPCIARAIRRCALAVRRRALERYDGAESLDNDRRRETRRVRRRFAVTGWRADLFVLDDLQKTRFPSASAMLVEVVPRSTDAAA